MQDFLKIFSIITNKMETHKIDLHRKYSLAHFNTTAVSHQNPFNYKITISRRVYDYDFVSMIYCEHITHILTYHLSQRLNGIV